MRTPKPPTTDPDEVLPEQGIEGAFLAEQIEIMNAEMAAAQHVPDASAPEPYYGVQMADGWVYPAQAIAAVRIRTEGNRRYVEAKLYGEPLPVLRSQHFDPDAAHADAESLTDLFCDKILFTPQTPEPPQLAEPSAPDVRPSHKFEGQNMGTFSGWQEESLIHPAQPQNPQGAPGYGTGPVTQRQAGPGPGAPHPFSTAPPSYLNHPMATHPQSFTQPHPSINNDVLAEIDAMGGAPGWMQRRR